MKKIIFIVCIFIIGISTSKAETIYMKVGETKTFTPYQLQTVSLKASQWTSSRPYDVEIISSTNFSCTVKATKSFSGAPAIIHCKYYYLELDPVTGRYPYERTGYVDYKVYVEEEEIRSIQISPTNIELDFGEIHEMKVTITPSTANQTVTWSSSNPSVATVNNHNILGACGYGTAVVTATASNGLKASCQVTVKKQDNNSSNNNNNNDNNNNNNNNSGQSSSYNELDYYYQISKKRMTELRNKMVQVQNEMNNHE